MEIFNDLMNLVWESGFFYLDWRMLVMWVVVGVLFYLAVRHQFEPLLLIPIGFGALLANLPTQGVLDKPAGEIHAPASGVLNQCFISEGMKIELPRVLKDQPDSLWRLSSKTDSNPKKTIQEFFNTLEEINIANALEPQNAEDEMKKIEAKAKGIPTLAGIVTPSEPLRQRGDDWKDQKFQVSYMGKQMEVSLRDYFVWTDASGMIVEMNAKQGQTVYKGDLIADAYANRSGGLFYYIQKGVKLEIFPPLVFLGVGAMTDFGPLIANPKMLFLGAAAQFGVFITFIGALIIGFTRPEAASIGIIGGADGPTSIFLSNKLAPHLLAPIAVAAYSYMALVPVIQPPIMRLLTTKKERKIRMKSLRKVSKLEKLIFSVMVTVFCILIVPDASALIGMLMLGNFIRESGVVERLNKAAQNELINIITIFLGTSVGITMTGDRFLKPETLFILCLGVVAFMFSTGAGVCMAKLMNLFVKEKINPLIGSAGVSAVPMAARVSHIEGQKADPSNFLLMHAMGPNVAGVIGSAMVAGFFISVLGG